MKNYLIIFITFFFIANCSLNKVIKHHGVHFLEKKHTKLKLNTSNKNDIMNLLGPPSTRSNFDNDLWIFIERNTSSSRLTKLGKKELITNNVLLLEMDNKGLLVNKIFLNKEDMQKIKFSDDFTLMSLSNKSFVYDFLFSVRQKINDPLGKKKTRVRQD